jgi:DNA-binding NarL/FixJ family response regulator
MIDGLPSSPRAGETTSAGTPHALSMASPAHLGEHPGGGPVRVVIGAGNLLVREGLERVVGMHGEFRLVGSGSTVGALAECVGTGDPHVVVVAVALPPGYTDEGLRLAIDLRRSRPAIGCVLLGDSVRPVDLMSFCADGVAGRAYLLPERIERGEEILHAIRTVASGGSVLDPSVVERLASRPDEFALIVRLTPREVEVLSLIADGLSNSAIGARLGLTTRAVEKHISEIFVRLDMPSGAEVSRRVAAALVFLSARGRLAPSG